MSQYLTFLALAALVACAPGPDTLLTLRATVVGGQGVESGTGIVMLGFAGALAAEA